MFFIFLNEQLKLLQCGWKLLLVFHMKSPYLGEEEDNFLQKKNAGSFIVLHALYMYLTWNTKFNKICF